MGELSKKIGEFGEDVAKAFLDEIGWAEAQKGIELPNLFKDLYNKKTYGIDYLKSYECPLIDGTVKNVLVSVKYHKDRYPESFRSKAKEFLGELSEILHSFSYSEIKSDANDQMHGSIVEDIGVLLWLTDKESEIDLRKELSNIRFEFPYEHTKVILIDNNQADFLFSSIAFIRKVFLTENIEFYYPNTGQNINPLTKVNSGRIMPIEFLSSLILPFKISEKERITLAVISNETYSKNSLRRIIGLAQELSTDLPNQILLAFPDYNELENGNEFTAVKTEFANQGFVEKIVIANINNNRFRTR